MTPEQIAYLGLLVITGWDMWYTLTSAAGNQMTIPGYSGGCGVTYTGNLPKAVYEVANIIRQQERDIELNILWEYQSSENTEYFYYHYKYEYAFSDNPIASYEFWFNDNDVFGLGKIGNRWECTYSSTHNPTSWQYLGQVALVAIAEGLGISIMAMGLGVTIAAFTPSPVAGWGWVHGVGMISVGAWLFSSGVQLITDGEVIISIPVIPIP